MGAQTSKKRKFVRNIDDAEVDAFYAKFRQITGGKEKMTREQFMKTYHDQLGDYAGQFYIRLAQKDPTGCLHMKPLLRTIDHGLSHFDVLAETLLLLFGDTKEEIMRNVVKIFCEGNKFTREDQVRLYEYFQSVNAKPTEQLQNFFSECPLFPYTAQYIFSRMLDRPGDSKMPKLLESPTGKSEILGRIDILIINSSLPFDRRKSWTLLYSNSKHGHSFSQMSKRISGMGAVLVVIRSAKGRRFGFFANQGFTIGPQYHGSAECFLFQVAPRPSVFTATGRAENYAYLNFQQQQMPNGMGLCGQEDVWPIFIHEDFTSGICQKNSRFFEPCHVADEEEFKIKTIEVWRAGDAPQKTFEEQIMTSSSPEKSIIDKDPEAKAILEMAGRSMKSEAFREPKPLLADE